jgi:hypothetical protein
VPVSRVFTEGTCGTQVCAAGYVVAANAPPEALFATTTIHCFYIPDPEGDEGLTSDGHMTSIHTGDVVPGSPLYGRVDIERYAQRALDITIEQADVLFSAGRSRGRLIAALDYLLDVDEDASGGELDEHVLRRRGRLSA